MFAKGISFISCPCCRYNLLEALYKYRHDADEEIFLYVLRNKMHEAQNQDLPSICMCKLNVAGFLPLSNEDV